MSQIRMEVAPSPGLLMLTGTKDCAWLIPYSAERPQLGYQDGVRTTFTCSFALLTTGEVVENAVTPTPPEDDASKWKKCPWARG